MRRLAGITVSSLLLLASVVAGPVSNAYANPTAKPAGLAASYRLHFNLDGRGYLRELMTLQENHTGYTDLESIVWSRKGAEITLVLTNRQDPSRQATYVGTILPGQISTKRHPGTITGPDGDTGTFYALDKTD